MKTIKLGYIGNEVELLANLLIDNGFRADSTCIFTPFMKDEIINFQQNNQLDTDGIVGYRTWETLLFYRHPKEQPLVEADFEMLAKLLDCEPAALKAIQKVETDGRGGFFAPGRPAILFEGHIFWNELKKRGLTPEAYVSGNEDILYPKWDKKHYKGGLAEYERLEKAMRIHEEAAKASTSWGMFQIMGFNYQNCDEKSVTSFVEAMHEGEFKKLLLLGRFIRKSGMLKALQMKDWATFARLYNGPAYEKNQYDQKLADAYKYYSSHS